MLGKRVVPKRVAMLSGTVALAVAVVLAGTASGSSPSKVDSKSTRGDISDDIKIHTKDIKVHTKEPITVIHQTATFHPGGSSGWHSHPGPVFVTVQSGTVTVYDASCTGRSYSAGQGFVEGPWPSVVRNEGGVDSLNVATLLVPVGTPPRTESPVLCPGIE